MYLSDLEEIIAFIVAIAIVIGFVASTYMEIKNTVAEEKEKAIEKKENEEKIKTLINYFDSKKKLIDTVVEANKKLDPKKRSEKLWKKPFTLQGPVEKQTMGGFMRNTRLALLNFLTPSAFNLELLEY